MKTIKQFLLQSITLTFVCGMHAETNFNIVQRANHKTNAALVRNAATNEQASQSLLLQPNNGDEALYADKRGSYAKALPHGNDGLPDVAAFEKLVVATQTGTASDFDAIPMGTSPVQRRLVSPQAALSYNLIGADPSFSAMKPAPTLVSAQKAGEMVEVYWMALLRDINFTNWNGDANVNAAIADLNNLSDFRGPKVNGQVTVDTLFRENAPGALDGPYVSQFFYKPIPASDTEFAQQYITPVAGNVNNFMTTVNGGNPDVDGWLAIQQGNNPQRTKTFNPAPRYIITMRDLGNFVHHDPPQWPYLNALLIMLNFADNPFDTLLDQSNPYIGNPTQEAFVDFFKPQFASLMAFATEMALRAAWYQKWFVHRSLRPEYFAFLVNQQITGALNSNLHPDVINSQAVQNIFALNTVINGAGNGTYLLPMGFPEGSPTHPSYPAGHATVAGANVTLLKAFFNEDFIVPNPVSPSNDGSNLNPIGDQLTLGGELNKFAVNIATARNMAGVHYRCDCIESLKLGEEVALAILEDWAYTNHIGFNGFSLTKFDGTTVTVGADKSASSI